MQIEHMFANSLAMQFLAHVELTDPLRANVLIDMDFNEVVARFKSWRVLEGDIKVWDGADVMALFRPVLHTVRKSQRTSTGVGKVRLVTGFTREAQMYIDREREDSDAAAVVHD